MTPEECRKAYDAKVRRLEAALAEINPCSGPWFVVESIVRTALEKHLCGSAEIQLSIKIRDGNL